MKPKTFYTLFSILVFASFLSSFITREPIENKSREPASLDYFFSNRCEKQFNPKKSVFNAELFIREVKENELRNGPTITEIQDSMSSPERFLAIIEYMSRNQNYKGFNFSDLVTELDKKELIKLYSAIAKATKSGKITEYDFQKLLVKVYRITHRPQGFWKTLWNTKDLRETFDRVDDQKILERIELTLFKEGYYGVFDVVFKDPGYRIRFKQFVSENRRVIDYNFAVALWTAGVIFHPEHLTSGNIIANVSNALVFFPPYIPTMSEFVRYYLTSPEKNLFLEKGLEQGYKESSQKFKSMIIKDSLKEFARTTYMTTFYSLVLVGMLADVARDVEISAQKEVATAQANYENAQNSLKERLELSKLSIEEQAQKDTDRYIEDLRKSTGLKLDENDPVTKKLRAENMETYRQVYAKTK